MQKTSTTIPYFPGTNQPNPNFKTSVVVPSPPSTVASTSTKRPSASMGEQEQSPPSKKLKTSNSSDENSEKTNANSDEYLYLYIKKKIMKQILKEIHVFLNNTRKPWHEFASIYASAMGGLLSVDDLILSYPFEVYNPSIWKKHDYYTNMNNYGKGYDLNKGFVDLEKEDEFEKNTGVTTEVEKNEPITIHDINNIDGRRALIEQISTELKNILSTYFQEKGNTETLSAFLKAGAAYVISALGRRQVKLEEGQDVLETDDYKKNYDELVKKYKEVLRAKKLNDIIDLTQTEEKGKEKETGSSETLTKIPLGNKSEVLVTSESIKKATKKATGDIWNKNMKKQSEPSYGTVASRFINKNILLPKIQQFDLDFDDFNSDKSFFDKIQMDKIELEMQKLYSDVKDEGMDIFRPEFRGLIIACVDNVNALNVGGIRDFTAYELCMSTIVRTQFAKYMALCSSPVNHKYNTKLPYKSSSFYGPNQTQDFSYRPTMGGNVIQLPSSNSRYVMTANKVDTKGFFDFMKRVVRNSDGLLSVLNYDPTDNTNYIKGAYGQMTNLNAFNSGMSISKQMEKYDPLDIYLSNYKNTYTREDTDINYDYVL